MDNNKERLIELELKLKDIQTSVELALKSDKINDYSRGFLEVLKSKVEK